MQSPVALALPRDLRTRAQQPYRARDVVADRSAILALYRNAGYLSAEVRYDLRFSEVTGATGYNVYGGTLQSLRSGVYDHAALAGLCGFTDASPGDGQVQVSVPIGSIPSPSMPPGGEYLLAVATNGAGESAYGSRSSGAPIPLAYSSCP